jgi:hypothetical protein
MTAQSVKRQTPEPQQESLRLLEKNSKKPLRPGAHHHGKCAPERLKSFLVLFFKKEQNPCFLCSQSTNPR